MIAAKTAQPEHFDLHELTDGVYAAIHKDGGAAYCNAGIIDLGDRTVVVDAFDTILAARELRQVAESLFSRPVDTLLLTHTHSDHWKGAGAFDAGTTFVASETTRRETLEWGEGLLKEASDPAEWENWVEEMTTKLASKPDERVCACLRKQITRARYSMAELSEFRPRYADLTFAEMIAFHGSGRYAEFRSFGAGHSSDDAVLLLPQDGIAFIGDIGFFNCQPYLGFCGLDLWREQLARLQESPYQTLVPGHGTLGSGREIALQLGYMEVMEELVGRVVKRGGSFEEAMAITLPEPYDGWMMGSMACFEINVRCLYERCGGTPPEQE